MDLLVGFLISVSVFFYCDAQIVSHELRRLAVASNQFGIDALKALDRIEPPDKVLVFCPVCLSSSLMMIMMGSSKYSVVSSLRHALYVWSMKPQDINQGFKDIFEHIGLNQQQQTTKSSPYLLSTTDSRYNSLAAERSAKTIDSSPSLYWNPIRNEADYSNWKHLGGFQEEGFDSAASTTSTDYLSLPNLIRVKEFFEKSIKEEPWWHSIRRKSDNSSRGLRKELPYRNSTRDELHKESVKSSLHVPNNADEGGTQRDTGDLSQMSAISNIYIQRGLSMNYNYNLLLRRYYKTVIHPVDFMRNGEETRQHINSLVAANTEGKIKDLVRKGAFEVATKSPKIMIISTFHFRGTLDIQMKAKDNTTLNQVNKSRNMQSSRKGRSEPSQTTKSSSTKTQQPTKNQVFIETEETLLKYGSFSDLGCSVVEIPFNNRLVSLIIVMPNHLNSTELLLTKLSAQVLNDKINSLVVKKISIEIPVIKFDRGPVNVEGILKELGLSDSFFGDKAYSSETGLNKWMRSSDIVHETSIDIGTINPKWAQTEDRLKVGAHDNRSTNRVKRKTADSNHIRLDKPFFYFVLDTLNGLFLTMGRIRQ